MNPYVFIVGCPRSGTTLVQRILDSHSMLAVIFEGQWIRNFWKNRIRVGEDGNLSNNFTSTLFNNKRFAQLDFRRDEIERLTSISEPVPYSKFVSNVLDLYGCARGKAKVGDKTPGYVAGIADMHQLWPKAKFIHVIRDGRNVCLSALDWSLPNELTQYPTWQEDAVTTIALWWERFVRLGQESKKILDANHLYELRYEDLIRQPEAECKKLCHFLKLPYEPQMLCAQSVTRGMRDWRFHLSNRDLQRFEVSAGELLKELGYHVVFQSFPESEIESAGRRRIIFGTYIRSLKNEPLPARWYVEQR